MNDTPTQLGPWILGTLLGAGETSSVHLCTHVDDPNRRSAIKILGRQNRETVARLRREAEILASLEHPNIVGVQGLDLEDRLPYLEMDYVPGSSLQSVLIDGPPPIADALDWASQLIDALAYLHARNVHHRDISAANLLLHEGRVVLVDFGLAKQVHGQPLTVAGTRFGSVTYAPPEWIGNQPVDGAVWDLYAFGVVLYELITGRAAFATDPDEAPNLEAGRVMSAKREVAHLDPGEQYPAELSSLVRELTAREPHLRPRSAEAVRVRLSKIAIPNREPERPPPPAEALSEGFRQASAVGTIVTAMVGFGAVALVLAVLWRVLRGVLPS